MVPNSIQEAFELWTHDDRTEYVGVFVLWKEGDEMKVAIAGHRRREYMSIEELKDHLHKAVDGLQSNEN